MIRKPGSQKLIELKGVEVQLEALLDLFAVRTRRNAIVHEISKALADVGLTTLPDFSTCPARSSVRLVELTAAPSLPEPAEDEIPEPLPPGMLPQRLLIGDLPSASGGVVCVPFGAQLFEATYLMRHKGIAQIPVTSNRTRLHGIVTWRSLALMYENGKEATLENAMQQESLPVFDSREDLFSCLPQLTDQGYLLVRDQEGELTGIVTYREIVRRFQYTARPFFLLGEIESLLRRWLGEALDTSAIVAVQGNRKAEDRTGSIQDLTFGDYVHLLDGNQKKQQLAEQADRNWVAIGHPTLDRGQFVHHLERVKDIRNRVAHFDTDPLPRQDLRELTAFADLLREYVR
ncbi:CBS domain-containing protein [Streptomyces sp. 061-3]|uniref:CBS domain-containing protein n=1 Tax=Streptomyces sp. 061-3 TaxID=2789268 RepID=UPI00397EA838